MKKLASIILIVALIISGCASSTPPETVVKSYFDSVIKNDLPTAATFVETGNTEMEFDDEQQEKMIQQIFGKIKYEIVSTQTDGDTATVKTKVTSPDLVKVVGSMFIDLMPQLFALAFSGQENQDALGDELINQYFENSLGDPNVPLTTTEIDIKLVKDDTNKSWLIKADEDLLNAMTGNIGKAFAQMDEGDSLEASATQDELIPDENIYSIGEEAVYGRAAITVLDVQKSQGSDFDKPKSGNEYVIVTLRERNAGEGILSYSPWNFKMQNSQGQIKETVFTIIDTDTAFESGELAPNGIVEGTMVFEAPINDTGLLLLFDPNSDSIGLLKFSLNQ